MTYEQLCDMVRYVLAAIVLILLGIGLALLNQL
jgi:hypothetical protein